MTERTLSRLPASAAPEGGYPTFVPLGGARPISEETLARLPHEERTDETSDYLRLYAVARLDGVAATSPAVSDHRDACRVLYVDAAGECCVEQEYRIAAGDWRQVEASVLYPVDAEVVGELAEHHRERYRERIAARHDHPELDDAGEGMLRFRTYTLFDVNGDPVRERIDATSAGMLDRVEAADERDPERAPHYAVSDDGERVTA